MNEILFKHKSKDNFLMHNAFLENLDQKIFPMVKKAKPDLDIEKTIIIN